MNNKQTITPNGMDFKLQTCLKQPTHNPEHKTNSRCRPYDVPEEPWYFTHV